MRRNDMTKYLVAGAAVLLFLGLTVWLIRSEGRRTRESIRDAAKDAAAAFRKELVGTPGKIARDVIKAATST